MKMSLKDLIEQNSAGTLVPDGYRLEATLDKGRAYFKFHPGWDDDGDALGDPIYLRVKEDNGPDQLEVLLGLLGVEAGHA